MIWIALGALALFAFTYWAFAYILLYHLTRFGVGTLPKRIAGIFLLGSFALISLLMLALANIHLDALYKLFTL